MDLVKLINGLMLRGIYIKELDGKISIKMTNSKLSEEEILCVKTYKQEILEYLRNALKEGSRLIMESIHRVALEYPDGWDMPEEIGERIDTAALTGDLDGLKRILDEWETDMKNHRLLYGTN